MHGGRVICLSRVSRFRIGYIIFFLLQLRLRPAGRVTATLQHHWCDVRAHPSKAMTSTARATALLLVVLLSSLILSLACLLSTVAKKARGTQSLGSAGCWVEQGGLLPYIHCNNVLLVAAALGEDVVVCGSFAFLAWLATACTRALSPPFDLAAGLVATSVFSGAALLGAVVTLADTCYFVLMGEDLPLSTLTMALGPQGVATLRTVRAKVPLLDLMVAGTVLAYVGLLTAATLALLRAKPWERWAWCARRFAVDRVRAVGTMLWAVEMLWARGCRHDALGCRDALGSGLQARCSGL